MEVYGWKFVNLLRGAEEESVGVLVCLHGRAIPRLIKGGNHLDVIC